MKEYALIGQNVLIIDKYFKMFFKTELKPYDLNATEGLVLLMFYGKKCRTQDQVIAQLHYDKGVMTRTMKNLEEKGFVVRHPNPGDSRSWIFDITQKSEKLKPTIIEILQRWGDKLLDGVEDLEVLSRTLTTMSENAYKAVKEVNVNE